VTLPARQIGFAAGIASLLLLVTALGFQYLGGLAPCPLCIWQRWPHAAAAALGILVLTAPPRPLAALGVLVMLVGTGIGVYHFGIEHGWWQGPVSCVAPEIGNLSTEELLERIMAAPVVRCDEIAWSFLGISMAGWNALASLVLAVVWAKAYASSSASQ
jgi:disulfide bond formation protein DsbB